MSLRQLIVLIVIFPMLFCTPVMGENGSAKSPADAQTPSIELFDDMADYMKLEAAQVKMDFTHQAQSLFQHTPLGWNIKTLDYAIQQAVMLPARVPQLISHILEQSRTLGAAGSVIMFVFFVAVGYSLIGRKCTLVYSYRQTARTLVNRRLVDEPGKRDRRSRYSGDPD